MLCYFRLTFLKISRIRLLCDTSIELLKSQLQSNMHNLRSARLLILLIRLYIFMEHCAGGDLGKVIQRCQKEKYVIVLIFFVFHENKL